MSRRAKLGLALLLLVLAAAIFARRLLLPPNATESAAAARQAEILASLGFFAECVSYLGRQDYVGAILLLFVGVSVIHVGAELARLALVERE